jgi:hypothetical protein
LQGRKEFQIAINRALWRALQGAGAGIRPLEGMYTKPERNKGVRPHGSLLDRLGKGKVFYFTPGHETYNDYYKPEVRQIFR